MDKEDLMNVIYKHNKELTEMLENKIFGALDVEERIEKFELNRKYKPRVMN